jgi:DhnA family fructose-bisphosphate aldolase class Ia
MVFLAGGEVADTDKLLGQMSQAIRLGVTGVCMGRNIFGSQQPNKFLEKLSRVVHGQYNHSPVRLEAIHA